MGDGSGWIKMFLRGGFAKCNACTNVCSRRADRVRGLDL
jgi:hypothetical protein